MSTPRYHINLFWSDEDACWIADVPDLKPCAAHGDTPAEAVTNVHDAIQGWIEVAKREGGSRIFGTPFVELRDPGHRGLP